MKLTVFLTLMTVLQVTAGSFAQIITLTANNKPLPEVMEEIKKQSGYHFFLTGKQLANSKVNTTIRGANLKEAMDKLTRNLGVEWVIKDKVIILRAAAFHAIPDRLTRKLHAQERVITGKVTDETGAGLESVTVTAIGTAETVVTDTDGNYRIIIPQTSNTLAFSMVGFEPVEKPVASQLVIDVVLRALVSDLNEVVVVGYGTQKKVNLTGAVEHISAEQITSRNVSNVSNALQGMMPGVTATQTSGSPGADGATIQIRGIGSLNSSSSPLILIDGVEGDMNNIDLNTIESISILKDAASASIYGSRASNGVVLITTKRAGEHGLSVSYNGFVGFNTPTEMPDPVSAVEYMEAINLARANSNIDPQYPQELIDQYKTLGADNMTRYDTDWRTAVIRNRAPMTNNSLSISSGSKDIKFFGNVGYYYQDGQIANHDYERFTLRTNTDANLTDWLKLGANINIRQSKTVRPSLQSPNEIISKATTFVPVFSGINADGTYGYGQNGDNPIATAEVSGLNTATVPELALKGFIEINPIDGLNIMSSYSTRRVENKSDYMIKPYDSYEGGEYRTTYPASGTQKYEGWIQTITNQFNTQASYETNMGKNFLKLLGGVQTEDRSNRSFNASRKGYEFDGYTDLDNGDISTAINNGSHWDWAMLSYFGRINYNFSERYLLELNGRWDASSRFKKEYRWGFFPSVSAGWRISEEAFFEPLKGVVDELKIRGSYGTLGNQDIYAYFPYAATIAEGYRYWFDEELGSGVAQTQAANEQISWEKSTQANVGLDAALMNNRLNLSFDYYVKDVNDMLQQFPIPLYVGFSSPWENAGSMENRGWGLSLSWQDNIGDFNYRISGNVSDVKNEVTNLYGKEYVGTQITREGDPIRSWYGYVSDGYFQSQDEIDASPVYGERKNVKPGYIRYKDLSGPNGVPDDVIDAFDRTIIGNSSPRFGYGLNMRAGWKNFDVTFFLQGVGKNDIFYSGGGARPFYIGRTIFRHQLDNWTEDNRNAEFPILLIDGTGANPNNIISDFWVKSGSYLRLKNLVIGYNFSNHVLQNMGIRKLRAYIGGQNLFTISNAYKGYDPENSVSSGLFYPVMSTYTFGIDLNF